MLPRITPKEKEKAIRYLINKVPKKTLREVYNKAKNKETNWWVEEHFGFGLGIRNILRQGGFGRDSITLDEIWHSLIEEAARSVIESPKDTNNI